MAEDLGALLGGAVDPYQEALRKAQANTEAIAARRKWEQGFEPGLADVFTQVPLGLRPEEMQAPPPESWRDVAGRKAGEGISALTGKDPHEAGRDVQTGLALSDFIPIVGDVQGYGDVYDDAKAGDWTSAAMDLAAAVLPVVPSAAGRLKRKAKSGEAVRAVEEALGHAPEQGAGLPPASEGRAPVPADEPDYNPESAAPVLAEAAQPPPPPPQPKTYKHPISGIKLDTAIEDMEAELVPFGKMREKRLVRPEELLGKTAILMRGDPAAAGQTLLGTGGRRYPTPVNLYGGEGYPRMEMNTEAGRVWASKQAQAQGLANRAADAAKENPEGVVGVYQRMHPRSTAYNTMLSEALLQEFKLSRSKISNKDVKEFDRLMREEAWDIKTNGKADRPAYPDWPGLDKLTPEYLRAAPDGKVRNKMFDLMDSREWRNKGFPNAGLANFATSDPALRDLPPNTVGGAVVNLDPGRVTSKESGHPTYESGVLGTEMGVMPNLPLDVYDPNYRLTGGTGGGPIPNGQLEKFLQTKPPIIKLDEPTLDRFMKYLRSQEGFKWGIGGAVAAGIISEEQARQISQAQDRGAEQ